MREYPLESAAPGRGPARGERAHIRTILLVLACFLAGLAGGVFLYYRMTESRGAAGAQAPTAAGLSEATRTVLKRLNSPVTIRFYALLDPATVPATLNDFAGRVSQLLSDFQQEANGMIKVSLSTKPSDAAASAASADGLKPFNLEKGEACYLGIVVEHDKRKEALPLLSPDWEQALEFDLSRAIARVSSGTSPATPTALTPPTDATALDAVKHTVPNFASLSVQEGTRILREKALADFAQATKDMAAQIQEAEQRLTQAQDAHSEAAQQAALKELQELRAARAEKLQQIAARLDGQIAALEELKRAAK